jgi:glutamine cyclotransferase
MMINTIQVIVQSLLMLFVQTGRPLIAESASGKITLEAGDSLPVYGYEIIHTYPHDTSAFTQGLYYKDGYMYEGTGLYGQSTLRKVVFETGTIIKIHYLDSAYFGEGITIYQDTIRQLTWRNDTGFIYIEGDSFECIGTFSYTTEGWGLTHNDTSLIMSDGTSIISFRDPRTFEETGQITVTAEGTGVQRINELEFIQGMIYANVWFSDSIAVIDPENGHVVCWIDCTDLLYDPPNVLNGIAFDPVGVRFFVTGKRWPTLFELSVDPINYPPRINTWHPPSPCSITTDSSLTLSVVATDPDPQDSLEYSWKIDGVIDTTAHDTSYVYAHSTPTVDTVTAIVSDGMYSDSISWIVYVSEVGIATLDTRLPSGCLSIPNPIHRNAWMTYVLSGSQRVSITMYDVLGRNIATLVDAQCEPGTYRVKTGKFEPGVYFIRVCIGQAAYIEKVVYIQ